MHDYLKIQIGITHQFLIFMSCVAWLLKILSLRVLHGIRMKMRYT